MFLATILTTLIGSLFGLNGGAWALPNQSSPLDSLCAKIQNWKPGEAGPSASEFAGEIGLIDTDFAIRHLSEKNWLLVDARGDKERKNGFFEGVVSLRSAFKADDPDDYSEEKILQVVSEHLGRPKLTWHEVQKMNFILFCNGEKCPKGPRAACALRKLGLSAKQVNVLPASYDQLLAIGLPVYISSRKLEGTSKTRNEIFVLRLLPGMDLKKSLGTFQRIMNIRAGSIVSVAGSLKVASLRFADQSEPTVINGPLEIVSLGGTMGASNMHLHMSVSDRAGKTLGGHLADGNIIYTTAEITILEAGGLNFQRVKDSQTTFEELMIQGR